MVPECDDKTMDRETDEYYKWTMDLVDAGKKIGIDLNTIDYDWSRMMKAAGFENTSVHRLLVPVGTWAKDKKLKYMGACWRVVLEDGVEAVSQMLLTRVLNKTQQETDEQIARVKAALNPKLCKKLHRYYTVPYAIGQRP